MRTRYLNDWKSRSSLGRQNGKSICLVAVSGYGRDHHASFNREYFNAGERNADPSIHNNTFIKYPVENVHEISRGGACALECHSLPLNVTRRLAQEPATLSPCNCVSLDASVI